MAQVFGKARVSLRHGCQTVYDGQYLMTITKTNISVGCHIWTHAEARKLKWSDVKNGIDEESFKRLVKVGNALIKFVTKES